MAPRLNGEQNRCPVFIFLVVMLRLNSLKLTMAIGEPADKVGGGGPDLGLLVLQQRQGGVERVHVAVTHQRRGDLMRGGACNMGRPRSQSR